MNLKNRLYLIVLGAVVLGASILALSMGNRLGDVVNPQIDGKAAGVAKSIESTLLHAVEVGVPFDDLNGVPEYLTSLLASNPEIKGAAVLGPDGRERWRTGAAKGDALIEKHFKFSLGSIVLLVDRGVARRILSNAMADLITVIVVTLLLAFEMVIFLSAVLVVSPLERIQKVLSQAARGDFSEVLGFRGKDEIGRFGLAWTSFVDRMSRGISDMPETARNALLSGIRLPNPANVVQTVKPPLVTIRTPLFLLVFAESLSLSFFPFYVKELYRPIPGLSETLVLGLPISIFMLFWAFAMPWAGSWSDSVGRRKPLIVGGILTAAGLVGTALAVTLWDLMIWRCLTAVGYGIVYITCQGFITDNTDKSNRTRGMAMFLASFFSGSLCGSAIGGILADRIGYRDVLYLSAIASLICAGFVAWFLREPRREGAAGRGVRLSDIRLVLSNPRFAAITVFSAIPAKITLTGFLYFAAPLFLKHLGSSQASIGRMLMGYGLMMIFVSPLVGQVADRLGHKRLFTNLGGIASGLALLLLYFWHDGPTAVLVTILLLGIAQSVQVSSQLALVTEECVEEGKTIGLASVVGVFRLIERLGNIAGPLVAGAFLAIFGSSGAERFSNGIALIGAMCLVFSITFAVIYPRLGKSKPQPAPAA